MNNKLLPRYRLIYQSYCQERFLQRYSHTLSLKLSEADLNSISLLPKSDDISKRVLKALENDKLIIERNNNYYSTIPYLDPDMSREIAKFLNKETRSLASDVARIIDNSIEIKFRHILLGNITLGYLWQAILNRTQCKKTSGSMVLISNPENNSTLYIDGLGNGTGTYITWIQTILQKNNQYLNTIFNHNDVRKMLSSISEGGDMVPFGEAAERLRLIKVTKLVSQKYTYISANHLVDPQITPELIKDLKPILTELTRIGVKVIKEITTIGNSAYDRLCSNKQYINRDFFVQAVYYVVCHELMKHWGELKILPEWRKVPIV